MKLFSKLLARKPSWQYQAGGTVWKLLCAENVLLGDTRDVKNHTASFFALDVRTGGTLWRDVTLPQAWWIGMQCVIGDTLLLHGFEKPDMPIPKGMYAVDVRTGAVRWSDPTLTYLFTINNRIYAWRASLHEKSFYEIDPLTGESIYDYGSNEEGIMQLRSVAPPPQEEPGYVFAESLHTRNEALQTLVLKSIDLSSARGAVDVAESNGVIIVAWHEPVRGPQAMLNNIVSCRLNILSSDGAILYEDTLVDEAPSPVPDVFFVKDDVLLYVKESSRVTGLRLADLKR